MKTVIVLLKDEEMNKVVGGLQTIASGYSGELGWQLKTPVLGFLVEFLDFAIRQRVQSTNGFGVGSNTRRVVKIAY